MFYLRDIPKHAVIRSLAQRYPAINPTSVEAFLILLRVSSDALTAMETFLARHGVSQGRFIAMMILNRNPETALCPSDLAAKSGVTRATMTGLIDGLERDKLVTRQSSSGDRRMTQIRLTPEGIQFLAALLPEYFRRQAKLMGNLSEEEKSLLEKILAKINTGIGAMLAP